MQAVVVLKLTAATGNQLLFYHFLLLLKQAAKKCCFSYTNNLYRKKKSITVDKFYSRDSKQAHSGCGCHLHSMACSCSMLIILYNDFIMTLLKKSTHSLICTAFDIKPYSLMSLLKWHGSNSHKEKENNHRLFKKDMVRMVGVILLILNYLHAAQQVKFK